MGTKADMISDIRGFNRFYTNILGLLDRHILQSEYSLTEARILFELNETGITTANALCAKLSIDKSYMSRMLSGFEKKGLIQKEVSKDDSRAYTITLSDKGQQVMRELSAKSSEQIDRLLAPLSDAQCREVHAAMQTIQKRLSQAAAACVIRPFRQEDVDFIISGQIRLYETEYGFTSDIWKGYVRDGVQKLVAQFDEQKDCVLILEANGVPAGCIAITHTGDDTARLRFFFVESAARGLGAGRRLMDMAIEFCRKKQYRHVFLWTCDQLDAARYLYASYGFAITDTHKNDEWGAPVVEERWDLEL